MSARLRVLNLPGDQFIIVLDRTPDALLDHPEGITAWGDNLRKHGTGCVGVVAFNFEVEL